jgi:hypothetical protein
MATKSNTTTTTTATNNTTNNLPQMVEFKAGKSTYQVPTKYKDMPSFSSVMRSMESDGYTRADIAKMTGARYQHVRNVLNQPVKSNQNTNQNQ